MLAIYAARDGDRCIFEDLIERLQALDLEIAGAVVSLFGHFRSRELGIRAAELVGQRVLNAAEVTNLAHEVELGMTSIFKMDSFMSGEVRACPPHPAVDVWRELVESWSARSDLTLVQRMRILQASATLGATNALEDLQKLLLDAPHPDDNAFAEDDYGHHLRAAVQLLLDRRRRLPMAYGDRLARATRPNVPYAGIEVIATHANRQALEVLLTLSADPALAAHRDVVLENIERLANRLQLIVKARGRELELTAAHGGNAVDTRSVV
jgi:hypothetical protein